MYPPRRPCTLLSLSPSLSQRTVVPVVMASEAMRVMSNGYPLLIHEGVRLSLHLVTISIYKGDGRIISLSEGNGRKKMVKKRLCQAIVSSVLHPLGVVYAYEGENILVAIASDKMTRQISMSSIVDCPPSLAHLTATVDISFRQHISPFDLENEKLPSLLEMIICSYSIQNSEYKKSGRSEYVNTKSLRDEGTFVLHNAYQISVKPIENRTFAAFVDPKIFISYPQRMVCETLSILAKNLKTVPSEMEMSNMRFNGEEMRRILEYVIGTNVRVLDDSDRVYKVTGMDFIDLETTIIQTPNGKILLKETKLFLQSRLRNFPLLEVESTIGTSRFLPMDMAQFVEYQRMGTDNPVYVHEMTSLNPQMREDHLKEHLWRMGIGEMDNLWLSHFGIVIGSRIYPLACRIPAPEVSYSAQIVPLSEEKRTWPTGKRFEYGGRADVFVVLIVADLQGQEKAKKFAEWYSNECRTLGISLPSGNEVICQCSKVYDAGWLKEMMRKTKEQAEGGKVPFLLYIDSITVKSHRLLKRLEQMFEVTTQHVTLEIALRAVEKQQRVTLQNIIGKTNKKLGGQNYSVNPKNDGCISTADWTRFMQSTLIVATDVCRPPTVAATVGLCSNSKKQDPTYFTGDFAFQAPRQERIDKKILNEFVEQSILDFKKNRSTQGPLLNILYLRDGVNESQHQFVYEEIQSIQSAAASQGLKISLIALLVLKNHNGRFLTIARQNPLPGLLVDKDVVHFAIPEFYLQPHRPLIGTAKAPLYRILANDANLEKAFLQEAMHLLAFGHQICNQPVSLPGPVYIAHELAKRGNMLLDEEHADPVEATMAFSYRRSPLAANRFNA